MTTPYRNPLHLYRALLRESTYLFHPAAQDFHGAHIIWSFRRKAKGNSTVVKYGEDGLSPLPSKDESQQMRRGRQYLYMLQRANQGYPGPMQNVLKMTFARKGKRRRELLKEIMAPPPANAMAADQARSSPTNYSKDWRPPEKFTMLLSSQTKLQSYLDARGKIKPQPGVPEKNRWNKPFPRSRVKGLMRKWYAKHADTLLPPLQEEEWSDLYKAASGSTMSKKGLPERRPMATVPVFDITTKDPDLFDVKSLMKTSPQAVEPQHSRRVRAIIRNPHHLTSRYMRRTVQRVLQNTPTALANSETGKLALRWETGIEPRKKPAVCTDSQTVTLFD
ncbi:hypothetical protein OHC33_000316 [Knufia fluminis]|uniref:LYR motif-containing protein Cup1-like N-terminal domain-containing protein n=1 Tax=Knufia fluminis TaxID=191047 RepID=A0AAN8EMD3_9EURO|nr:hypothetical protein OHC33_000316 [Knufia fluminis]